MGKIPAGYKFQTKQSSRESSLEATQHHLFAMSKKEDVDESLVYQITPEVVFSPSVILREKKNVVYRVGTVLPPRESRNIEYKLGGGNYCHDILPLHVRKYGSAFLNSNGGTLCIGVRDDGVVVGVRMSSRAKQKIREIVRDELQSFTPPVYEDLYELDFVPCNKYELFVIELHIRPGNASEIYSDKDNQMFIKRDGSVQGPLWPKDIREIVRQKFFTEVEKSKSSTADPNTFPLLALSKK